LTALLLLAALAAAQAQPVRFEVASIKPSAPGDMSSSSRGGPGPRDPGRWMCRNLSLRNLVTTAFDLRPFQLSAPDWLDNEHFDVTAKVPAGAGKEQFSEMMQDLLVDRFGLRYHRESKETQGFELVIAGSGPKLDRKAPVPEGFSPMPPGMAGMMTDGVRTRSQWLRTPLDRFAAVLSHFAGRPVVDATGLTGRYDLALYWVSDAQPDAGGPDLFTALQEQLGLKLQPKKVVVTVLVVDRMEKRPTEN
jgi:uncharacterized protein (TIGR03435 family)